MIYSKISEIENKNCKRIKTNHLIALCEVSNDYKSFCEDLEKLIKSKIYRNLVNEAYHVMQGKFSIFSNKYKNFIEKHKRTIEIMNKYYCLSDFTVLSYDEKGARREDLAEDYFYQYIEEHIEDIETIKAVALKIKSLGFHEIDFGEKLDFTRDEYELDTLYGGDFAFLENMEVKPSYFNIPIQYKTTGSC